MWWRDPALTVQMEVESLARQILSKMEMSDELEPDLSVPLPFGMILEGNELRCTDDLSNPPDSELPSSGSANHWMRRQKCKPCAFFDTDKGCKNGTSCMFCHLCGTEERKRRRKVHNEKRQKRLAKRLLNATVQDPWVFKNEAPPAADVATI